MFNWVKKILRTNQQVAENKPVKVVQVDLGKSKKAEKLENVSKFIRKFDENLEKFEPLELSEIKEIYKAMWWKPNNFLDKETTIYLISRLQLKYDWE